MSQLDPNHPIKVVALYKFVDQPDFECLKEPIASFCCERGIRGTLLLAPEGINGTVAGTSEAIDQLIAWLEDGNLFGGRAITIQQAEIEGRGTFHRVRVAASDRQDAIALCEALKRAGGSCFVAR